MDELNIRRVLEAVNQKFQVAPQDIVGKSESRGILEARCAFVYLAMRLVHSSRMKKTMEEDPEVARRAGFAVMRHFEREITDELCGVLNVDYKAVRRIDEEAIQLREMSKEFYDKTEDIWAKLDETYGLNTIHSPVIWLDRETSETPPKARNPK